MAKKLMKGNVAMSEAALRAGCTFYAGYPITPQTEVMETLSGLMQEQDRTFIQAENEIAAISMVSGAAWVGEKSMTSSSGPGISLKQEGISYIAALNLPCVILNVCRWGNGLGSLDSAQTDYLRETRGGGHGDYRSIVMAPASIQEGVDMMYDAFEVAEKYQNPVVILTEAALGQMMEAVDLPPYKDVRKLEIKGGYGRASKAFSEKYLAHRKKMVDELERWECVETEEAEYIFVAFGMPSRVVLDTVKSLRENGEKVGMIRPIHLWPFPYKAFADLKGIKGFIAVETNECGQMVEDVAMAAKKCGFGNTPVYSLATGSVCVTEKQILEYYEGVKKNMIKEDF